MTKELEIMNEIAEQVFEEVSDEIVHKNILEKEQRPDGRKLDEIRKIECQVGILATNSWLRSFYPRRNSGAHCYDAGFARRRTSY